MNRDTDTTTYESTASYAEIGRRLRDAQRIILTSHFKPDGDAVGSVLGLARALRVLEKDVDILLMGPIEPNLEIVIGDTPYQTVETSPPHDEYDLIVVVDTGAWTQLEPIEDWLRRNRRKVVGIDHHARGDDVAPMRIIDAEKASTTQMIVALLDEMGCSLTGGVGGVAEALFVGLATDTGWFRHNNAGAEVFSVAARLLARGVDKSRLYQIIEETHRPERLALEARALTSLEYARGRSIAIMSLTLEDFEGTGGVVEDLTGLVNMPMVVGEVRVAVLLAQSEPGLTKISFRSKPPIPGYDESDFVDVNKLAQRFGGGGHVHAAGARLDADLPEARRQLLEVIGEEHPEPLAIVRST